MTSTAFAALGVIVTADNTSDPVVGGTVTFTVNPSGGASATLSSPVGIVAANGKAQVGATANAVSGSYSVTASAAGASATITFQLTNQFQPVFSALSAPTIAYGTAGTTLSGTIAAGDRSRRGNPCR